MKFQKWGLCFFLSLALFVACIGGCGSNLFVDVDEDGTKNVVGAAEAVQNDDEALTLLDELDDLLREAHGPGEFGRIKNAADAIIDKVNRDELVSDEVKNAAYKLKGEAGLGELAITPLTIIADLLSASTSNTEIEPSEFLDRLGLSDAVTSRNMKEIASAYNAVDASFMTSSNYALKAIADTVYVVEVLQEVYDADTQTFIGSPTESLALLITRDSDGKNIISYSNEAVDSYEKSGFLDIGEDSAEAKKGVESFQESTLEMEELQVAATSNGVYRYNDVTYDFENDRVTQGGRSTTYTDEPDNKLVELAFANILSGKRE